ncbi:hypothetical protein STCU_10798 [Strigomonas culicis]|uniref:Uncharacterized protein n=1 Tax=Strigomonas culicis TaxID=28005 RepID=S9V2Y3_9TRYP|nr:hypothetical protein STCU_10798 [Strigomonas culicis]|eukprot:EPY17150.1 hypothetical protein STCU_10798 [Strigomonas culicis]
MLAKVKTIFSSFQVLQQGIDTEIAACAARMKDVRESEKQYLQRMLRDIYQEQQQQQQDGGHAAPGNATGLLCVEDFIGCGCAREAEGTCPFTHFFGNMNSATAKHTPRRETMENCTREMSKNIFIKLVLQYLKCYYIACDICSL